MKVVLLAGGMGTRLSEETDIRPKPMVEIGGNDFMAYNEDILPLRVQ
jgi:glucose-1-phosphate cytidylyltransferase